MTEYSSMKFAWFFLAEYINMLNVSAVATTLFFGGWRAPFGLHLVNDGMFNEGWWPLLWFLAKLWFFMFLFVWIRGTLLRFRYDQFMKFGWKVLIPAALAWIVCVSVVQGVLQFTDIELRTMLIGLGILALVGVAVSFLIPEKKTEPVDTSAAATEPFDAFAGGYPVPPLPGQTLPLSPRRARALAQQTAQARAATATLESGPDEPSDAEEETPRG